MHYSEKFDLPIYTLQVNRENVFKGHTFFKGAREKLGKISNGRDRQSKTEKARDASEPALGWTQNLIMMGSEIKKNAKTA